MSSEQTLETYLADRTIHELRRIQQARNARVYGKASRCRDLRQSLLHHARITGLSVTQCRDILEQYGIVRSAMG